MWTEGLPHSVQPHTHTCEMVRIYSKIIWIDTICFILRGCFGQPIPIYLYLIELISFILFFCLPFDLSRFRSMLKFSRITSLHSVNQVLSLSFPHSFFYYFRLVLFQALSIHGRSLCSLIRRHRIFHSCLSAYVIVCFCFVLRETDDCLSLSSATIR